MTDHDNSVPLARANNVTAQGNLPLQVSPRFEPLQIATGKTPHPLVEPNNRNGIDSIDFKSAVYRYDIAVISQQFISDRFEQSVLQSLQQRRVFFVEHQRNKPKFVSVGKILKPIRSYQNAFYFGRNQFAEPFPVGGAVEKHQNCVRLDRTG